MRPKVLIPPPPAAPAGSSGSSFPAAREAARLADAPGSDSLSLLKDTRLSSASLLQRLDALAAQNPESPGVHEALGRAHEKWKNPVRAIEYYQRAVQLDPQRWEAWLRLGILLKREDRDSAGAVSALRRALETGAPRAQALNELGVAYAHQKKLEEALEIWREAIKEEPQWGVLYSNALKALVALDRKKEARALFEQGRSADRPEENLFIQWGEHLIERGDKKEAAAVYEDAVRRLPQSAALAYYYAQALLDLDEIPEARVQFGRAVELDSAPASSSATSPSIAAPGAGNSGSVAVWSRRALFILDYPDDEKEFQKCVLEYFDIMQSKDRKKAIPRFKSLLDRLEPLLRRHPDFWNTLEVKAWTLRRLGRYGEAGECLERAIAIYPEEPNAWHEKGLLLREQGKLDEGYQCLLRARRLAPSDVPLLMNLALAEIDLQRWDEAKAHIARVERLLGADSAGVLRDYYHDRRSGKPAGKSGEIPEVPISAPR